MLRHSARSPSITSQESYSAVMITDLVADVPVSIETEDRAKSTKEVANLAYDGHLDGQVRRPTLEDTTQKTNGSGISRGVILNAVQFGQNDSKTKSSDEKPIQLTASLPVPALTQQISDPKGFKNMSFLRKVAFGFSFLPSVLFVLCFAIILPCNVPKPCIDEIWIKKFNDTEATSGLEIPKDVVFTVLKHGQSVLFELDKNNGKLNEIELDARSSYLACGKIMNKDTTDCIVMDEAGKVYSFNNSHSRVIWNPVSEVNGQVSNPVILSGCKNEMEDVGLAVSSSNIKIMYSGNKVSTFSISDCDSVPIRLMPWVVNGSSSIVFVCEKDGEDRLISIPKDVWCTYTKNPEEEPIVLESGALGSLKNSVFQPLEDGLVVWSKNEASMIQPNGTYLWKVSNLSHSQENRFIRHGNFHGENKQVAFFSSSLSSGLKVTLLDPSTGSFIKTVSHSNCEATEMIHVQGEKRDYVLMLLKKTPEDIVTSTIRKINDISTTIVSLVSNEEVNPDIQVPVSEELALLDLDGNTDNIDTIKVMKDLKDGTYKNIITDGTYKSTITAVSDKGVLRIYFLSTSELSRVKTTEVRNIDVANWDKSAKSKCKVG